VLGQQLQTDDFVWFFKVIAGALNIEMDDRAQQGSSKWVVAALQHNNCEKNSNTVSRSHTNRYFNAFLQFAYQY
jgi:hypothetical protein